MAETRKAGVRRKAVAASEPMPEPEPTAELEPVLASEPKAAGEATGMDLAVVRAQAAKHGSEAIAALAKVMNEGTSESARIAAANALLERGYGKGRIGGEAEPPPPVDTVIVVRFV